MRCEAKSKQSGQQCKRHAVPGKKVCAIHGGKSLAGLASPSLKTGRHSRYLPPRMREKYDEALHDGELLGLRDDISLIDARLEDLLKRVDTGEAGAIWNKAREALEALSEAVRGGNPAALMESLVRLENIIRRGQGDYHNWSEIGRTVEQRRRLVESERKRLVEMQQMITYERAALMFGVITDAIRRNVSSAAERARIAEDLRAIFPGASNAGQESLLPASVSDKAGRD